MRIALRLASFLVCAVLVLAVHQPMQVARAQLTEHTSVSVAGLVPASQITSFLPSFRKSVLSSLRHADTDVLLVVCGVLLIYFELNVPGVVLPGACGIFLLLLGVFGLTRVPIRPWAVLLLALAPVPLVLAGKAGGRSGLTVVGSVCLASGFAFLVKPSDSELGVHLVIAVFAGVILGVVSAWLTGVAFQARRNKRCTGSPSEDAA